MKSRISRKVTLGPHPNYYLSNGILVYGTIGKYHENDPIFNKKIYCIYLRYLKNIYLYEKRY